MRSVFCILLVLLTTSIFAQQKHVIYPMGWRGNRIELHTISDKEKRQSCTFVVKTDSIRALVFNDQVQLVQQFSIPTRVEEALLGGFFRDGKVYLFLECNQFDYLRKWVLDISSGAITEHKTPFELKKEKIIDRISCGDHFVYFTASKKTSEFKIYDFRNEQDPVTMRYSFGENTWQDITKSSGLGRSINIEKVDMEGECNIDAAVIHNKIYVRNDTLHLLMNGKKGITTVYSFDLQKQQVNTRRIIHRDTVVDENAIRAPWSENSYLLGNTLYYVQATYDTLCVQLMDFQTGEPVKTYIASSEGTIDFKNTPVVQEGGAYSAGDTRELGKTKQLLRKMVNGEALIMATPEGNNQAQVVVGSYARMSSGGGGGMWMPGGGTTGMVYVPTGGFTRNAWTKSARFKMLVHAQTGAHMEGQPGNTINEKIAYYTGGIKIPPEGENLFATNGHYYFAYWDTKERRLVILKF